MMTFPQVVIDGEPLGGYQELVAADRDGRLAELAARPRALGRGWQRLADVGPAPGGAQLAHGPAAVQARLALAQVDRGTGPGRSR